MKLNILFETPLEHYKIVGLTGDKSPSRHNVYGNKYTPTLNDLDNDSYSDSDIKQKVSRYNPDRKPRLGTEFGARSKIAIKHPKTQEILIKKLSKTKIPINVIIDEIDSDNNVVGDYSSIESTSNSTGIPINSLKNSINFVLQGTAGDTLTPWMILHQIGEYNSGPAYGPDFIYQITNILINNNILNNYKDEIPIEILQDLFLMKSSRQGFLQGTQELTPELYAEYLWHGRIRRNKHIKTIPHNVAEQIYNTLEDDIKSTLYDMVGKITQYSSER